jgi:heme/copper-type cytochrome/quinol oxidase subunit 2
VAFVPVVAIALVYVFWLANGQSPVRAGTGSNRSVQLTLQTVGAIGPGYPHADWVSYLAQEPAGKWIHSTDLQVPANSLVHVTIYQYDSSSGLRNPYFGQVQGTTGGAMRVDRTAVRAVDPNAVAHTFAIPQLGVYVPLPGIADDATNSCSAAPCAQAQAHRTITFTFRTKGKGRYRWQCFVPCGAGFVTGNGGPMQALNYMAGSLTVV